MRWRHSPPVVVEPAYPIAHPGAAHPPPPPLDDPRLVGCSVGCIHALAPCPFPSHHIRPTHHSFAFHHRLITLPHHHHPRLLSLQPGQSTPPHRVPLLSPHPASTYAITRSARARDTGRYHHPTLIRTQPCTPCSSLISEPAYLLSFLCASRELYNARVNRSA